MSNGIESLIIDIKTLLQEAEDGEFGDFTSVKYDMPITALANRLDDIKINAINGKYDG